MRLRWGVLVMLVMTLCRPLAAQVNLTFDTVPPGADIKDQYGNFLGKSGSPVLLDTSKYITNINLEFSLAGYRVARAAIQKGDLRNNKHYPDPPVTLTPETWWALARQHRFPLLAAVLALGVAIFSRRAQQQRLTEMERRSRIVGQGDSQDSLVSQVLGGYRLIERLGQGGMATVYRALPESNLDESQQVAVKVLRRDLLQDAEFAQRFRREAALTCAMDHPHAVRMIEWGEDGGYIFLVMELVAGGTLRDKMRGPMSPSQAWSYLDPLCQAIEYANSKGIVHRDLKPENIMITTGGCLKVMDFGLARSLDQEKITRTGTTLGTPAYMAPEQIQSSSVDPSIDQYAVGIIAFELLTGRVPFDSSDMIQVIFQQLNDEPPPPSSLAALSSSIDEVVLGMLRKLPEERYPTLAVAALALEAPSSNLPV